ncbi:MAG TPA: thioredoxin-disulfide reductase [Candidatus Gastranaerophilales bacterium]|nr:thioredoxin-disulfide reductase [Candidatus Gastranaerophilales bacterium]
MNERKEYNYDLIILGAGPAGLSAAIYACRSALKTVIIDTSVTGGQLNKILEIENYPAFPMISGFDLAEKFEEHADKFNIEKFLMQKITGIDFYSPVKRIETEEGIFKANSIIIATGAQPQKLGVPGEDELIGRGVSYCAVCDAAFFRDKVVSVAGGGNSAVEEGLYLARFASKVNIIHRRDALRADKIYQDRAKENPKINFILDTVVTSVNGENKVESLSLKNVKTGEAFELATDGVFPFIGYSPNSELFKDQLQLDERGFIKTDSNLATSCEGVFAAGDIRVTPLRQIITAVADGAVAATKANEYLKEREFAEIAN